MPNLLSRDEQCVQRLLEHLGKDNLRYVDVLTLQDELRENRKNVEILGESENLRNDWARIRKSLNLIAVEATGQGFDELCPLPNVVQVAPGRILEAISPSPRKSYTKVILLTTCLVIVLVGIGWRMLLPLLLKASSPTPTLTRSPTTPTFASPPTDEPFKIRYITFDPTPPASAAEVKVFACTQGYGGVGITLKLSINTAPDGSDTGEWRGLKELGVPCFNAVDAPIWFTKGWPPGTYQVKAEAKSFDDPYWEHSVVMTVTYTLLGDK